MLKAVWGHGEMYPRLVMFPYRAAPMAFEESVTLEMPLLLNTQLTSSRASGPEGAGDIRESGPGLAELKRGEKGEGSSTWHSVNCLATTVHVAKTGHKI